MIRKLVTILVGIIFLGIFSFAYSPRVLAVDTASPSFQNLLQTNVDYELPYPGLLPDNFLYPLKVLRDRVVSFFISDPQKKAEFDLLQADKRLAAGESLLQENTPNNDLISQTISKGENYFADAVVQISLARQQGQVINDFLSKLQNASIKHQQVLYGMTLKSNDALKQSLLSDIDRMQEYAKEVKKLMPQ